LLLSALWLLSPFLGLVGFFKVCGVLLGFTGICMGVGQFFGFGWDFLSVYWSLLGPNWFKLLGFALVWLIIGIVVRFV